MNLQSIALLTVLMLHLLAAGATAQRTQFLRTEDFDTTRLRPGTFVQVSYYTGQNRETGAKGYVFAVRDSSFTVASAIHRTTIPFRDVDILIIGRGRPEIILFKNGYRASKSRVPGIGNRGRWPLPGVPCPHRFCSMPRKGTAA